MSIDDLAVVNLSPNSLSLVPTRPFIVGRGNGSIGLYSFLFGSGGSTQFSPWPIDSCVPAVLSREVGTVVGDTGLSNATSALAPGPVPAPKAAS